MPLWLKLKAKKKHSAFVVKIESKGGSSKIKNFKQKGQKHKIRISIENRKSTVT